MRVVVVLTFLCACGRIGYDPVADGGPDGPAGASPCPADTVEVAAACIEEEQRGVATWTAAKASCESLDRRLCSDLEWLAACLVGSTAGMTDDWEWLAEESGGIADKRGSGGCSETAVHEILVDAFGYRCCADPP